MNDQRILFRAAAIADGAGVNAAPGAILVDGQRIIGSGLPRQIGEVGDARVVDLSESVILPGLVNSHCHLDLSHIGPQPCAGDFPSWIDQLRAGRKLDAKAIGNSVKSGIEKSRDGGTAIIGDIAGITSLQPLHSLRESGLAGVSFLEVFGLSKGQNLAIERMGNAAQEHALLENGVALGVQPHAPYSCGVEVYRAASEMNLPLSTHLSETLDEIEFIQAATGPLAAMLKRIGVWDDAILGYGCHPIDHLMPFLKAGPFIAAHVNYLTDSHLLALAKTQVTVAYCPRATAYFKHEGHRYRDMLDYGINVALGTDSLICLDTPDRISVLDEMRLLFRRDGVDVMTLLKMATVNGARALGFDSSLVTLSNGLTAGLLAVSVNRRAIDPIAEVMRNNEPPHWIVGPFKANNSWWKGIER